VDKREFLRLSVAAGLSALAKPTFAATAQADRDVRDVPPITVAERRARVEKLQELMQEAGVDSLLLEAGSSLLYFTGIDWWRSERFTGAVIPAEGEIGVVTPHFEEPSVRESLAFGDDVRTWNEHENPYALVAGILADRGYKSGTIAAEETVRYFIVDGVLRAAPRFTLEPGAELVRACRMLKSSAELALLQAANDVTLAAYRHVFANIETGYRPDDIQALMSSEITRLGATPGFVLVLLNDSSAYPHGTDAPQTVREGGVILMDCGCSVSGYQSDISRTWVHGEATKKQREVWNTVKRGQEIALETARPGTPAGKVDDAVRAYYESLGYGPGYRTPGLPHRTGHGIGLDVHEPVNFVHGETTPLAPGMCFSDEPGLYIYGEFGVRLEDCLYMSEDGPRLFTPLSRSLDEPFA
jgi:Xaa-Pro dipeptidase